MGFRVVHAASGATLPGIPTPGLIEQGGGEAFFFESRAQHQSKTAVPEGVWYAKDATHQSADGQYTRVRIVPVDDWRVDVSISVVDPSVSEDDAPEDYADYFIVEAATRQEAEDLAAEAARADVERRFGEEASAVVSFLNARKGVSI